MPPLYLLDASIFFFKAYFLDLPYKEDESGQDISAVLQFARTFLRFLNREKPVYIAAAFDESLFTGFRHELSDTYKSNRALPDDSLSYQLQMARQLIESLGIKTYACDRFEADDYIASLAALRKIGQSLVILSNDKDLGQLIGEQDSLLDYSRNERLGQADIEEKFSVKTSQIADFLALAGDTVDGIAGVPGVGAKTAQQLLMHFLTIDNLLKKPEDILNLNIRNKQKVYEAVLNNKDQLAIDQQLTRLYDQIDVGIDSMDALKISMVNRQFFSSPSFISIAPHIGNL